MVDILVEIYNEKIKKYKQTTQKPAQTADTDGGADNSATAIATANTEKGVDKPGIGTDTQQTQIRTEKRTQAQSRHRQRSK